MSNDNKFITNSVVALRLTPAGNESGDEVTYEKSATDADSQTWDFTSDGFFVHKPSGYVLEAPTDSDGNIQTGIALTIAEKASDKSNQKWTYGTPEYKIVSQQDTSLCIWVPLNQINPGVEAVVMAEDSSKPTQRFFLLPA